MKKSFCVFLLSMAAAASFAFTEKDILSPAAGQWANLQSLVLDSNNASEIYYSLSGTDPFVSGFAYDGPVLIEKKDDVCVRIGVVEKDGEKKEFRIEYRISEPVLDRLSSASRTFAESIIKTPIIAYYSGSEFPMPEDYYYSFDNERIPFLKGKIFLEESNCLERYIPFTVTDGINSFHSVLKVLKNSTDKIPARLRTPFEIKDWNTFIFTDRNFIYQIDGEMWNNDSTERLISRKTGHVVKFQAVDYKSGNEVYELMIPAKPSISQVKKDNGLIEYRLKTDDSYCFINGKKSISIQIFDGEESEGIFEPEVYYDGNVHGSFRIKYSIDRLAPEAPVIHSSNKKSLSRSSTSFKIRCPDNADIFYAVSEPVVFEDEFYDFDSVEVEKPSSFYKYRNNEIVINAISDKVSVYKIFAYSKDSAGNRSHVVEQKVIVDELNYYLSSSSESKELSDGSFMNPFSSFEEAVAAINSSKKETRVHISGTFDIGDRTFVISEKCRFYGHDCRLVFGSKGKIELKGTSAIFENISMEKNSAEVLNEPLLKTTDSSLKLSQCELSAVVKDNCTLVSGGNSDVKFTDCGFTVSAENYSMGADLFNCVLVSKGCRYTSVSKNANNVKVAGGKCLFDDESFTAIGFINRCCILENTKAFFNNVKFASRGEGKSKLSAPVSLDENSSIKKYVNVVATGF